MSEPTYKAGQFVQLVDDISDGLKAYYYAGETVEILRVSNISSAMYEFKPRAIHPEDGNNTRIVSEEQILCISPGFYGIIRNIGESNATNN